MKSKNKALIVIIVVGVIFMAIGASVLGVNAVRRNLADGLADGSITIVPATNPVSGDRDLPALHAVDLRLGAVEVDIVPSDRNRLVSAGFDKGELTVRLDEKSGTLSVEQRDYDSYHDLSNWNEKITRTLTLYLDAATLDSFALVLGAGTLNVDGMHAQAAELKIGAGDLALTGCTYDEIELTLGAGDLDCTDCAFSNLDLTGGAASIRYNGTLGGWCELKNGVGEMRVQLTDSAENYSFQCTQGIGDISINGSNAFGMGVASNNYGESDAPTTIAVRSGVGSVQIDLRDD